MPKRRQHNIIAASKQQDGSDPECGWRKGADQARGMPVRVAWRRCAQQQVADRLSESPHGRSNLKPRQLKTNLKPEARKNAKPPPKRPGAAPPAPPCLLCVAGLGCDENLLHTRERARQRDERRHSIQAAHTQSKANDGKAAPIAERGARAGGSGRRRRSGRARGGAHAMRVGSPRHVLMPDEPAEELPVVSAHAAGALSAVCCTADRRAHARTNARTHGSTAARQHG